VDYLYLYIYLKVRCHALRYRILLLTTYNSLPWCRGSPRQARRYRSGVPAHPWLGIGLGLGSGSGSGPGTGLGSGLGLGSGQGQG
jgi:hypothetical protein